MGRDVVDFGMFCEHEYSRLVGSLGLYVGNRDEAEELAQEALARAWQHWGKVSRASDPAAWLYRVAFNVAKSRFRRLAAERRARARVDRNRSEERASDPADIYALRVALTNLPHRYKTVLVLHYYLGLTFPEIASRLDIPIPTAKTWARRGIASLRGQGLVELKEELGAG